MSNQTSSIYIPLEQNYALLELEYNSKIVSTRDSHFLRIKNAYTGSINYLSFNPIEYRKAEQATKNVLDRTVQQISHLNWVHFDIDRPIRYFEQRNREILFESLWHDFSNELFITYHRVRVYLLAGYTFNDIAGFIIRASYTDRHQNQVFVANIAHLKDEDFEYNLRPFQIGDKVYDKYIEFFIPSLQDLKVIDSYISSELKATDELFYFKKKFPDINTSQLNIFFYEVKKYNVSDDGQLILTTVDLATGPNSGIYRRDLEIFDKSADLTAVIRESRRGDYFELFLAYKNQFIEDFLYERLQNYNEEYLIIHNIDVYEQIYSIGNFTEVRTQSFSQIQESGFDQPFKFRPIIENPNTVAFTIEYTVRLFNKTSPSYIIRRASYTSLSKKYGRYLQQIDINYKHQPIKVVNKIFKNYNLSPVQTDDYLTFLEQTSNADDLKIIEKNIFLPFSILNVCINAKTMFVRKKEDSDGQTDFEILEKNFSLDDLVGSSVIYGQGDGRIYLSKFDNFIKIQIFRKENQKLVPYDDFTNTDNFKIFLVFEDVNKLKIKIPTYQTNNTKFMNLTLQPNEFLFKVDKIYSERIINNPFNDFWIVAEHYDQYQPLGQSQKESILDFESVIYHGHFYSDNDLANVTDPDYKSKEVLLNEKIQEFNSKTLEFKVLEENIQNISRNINLTLLSEREKQLVENYIKQIKEIMAKATQI